MKHLFKGTKWDVPCERCGVVLSQCKCPPPPPPPGPGEAPPEQGRVTVQVEKRAKGKRVTVVRGVVADQDALGQALRALCGAGGTVKDGTIEVQGEHEAKVRAELERRGLTPEE